MRGPGPALRKSAGASRSAGARGGSGAPSHRTRKSSLKRDGADGEEEEKRAKAKQRYGKGEKERGMIKR